MNKLVPQRLKRMRHFLSKSIVTRLNIPILSVITLVLVGFALVIGLYQYNRTIAALNSTAENTLKLASIAAQEAIWNFDDHMLTNLAQTIMLDENVIAFQLFIEGQKKPFLIQQQDNYKHIEMDDLKHKENLIYLQSDITKENGRIGSIHMAISKAKVQEQIQKLTLLTALFVVLLIFVVGYVVNLTVKRKIKDPINILEKSTEKLAHGHLKEEIDTSHQDEIGHLAQSLSDMCDSFQQKIQEQVLLNRTLDECLKDRTEEIKITYDQLKETQTSLVQFEKMASLSQLVAGIANGINVPLNTVKHDVKLLRNIIQQIKQFTQQNNDLIKLISTRDSTDETISAQLQVVTDLLEMMDKDDSIHKSNTLIKNCTDKLEHISDIVRSLKKLDRVDHTKVDNFNINDGLDSALKIVYTSLEDKISIVKLYQPVPLISCSPTYINQVFLNLIMNATEAIEDKGIIQITTLAKGDYVQVVIRDDGKGIAKDILPNIFDPFFTTKPEGEGTGLGLSISRTIIEQQHNGKIRFISEQGKGTAAIVSLPIRT